MKYKEVLILTWIVWYISLYWIYPDLRPLIILDTRKIFKEQNVWQQKLPACSFICFNAEILWNMSFPFVNFWMHFCVITVCIRHISSCSQELEKCWEFLMKERSIFHEIQIVFLPYRTQQFSCCTFNTKCCT